MTDAPHPSPEGTKGPVSRWDPEPNPSPLPGRGLRWWSGQWQRASERDCFLGLTILHGCPELGTRRATH
jgi:hypothetical protein